MPQQHIEHLATLQLLNALHLLHALHLRRFSQESNPAQTRPLRLLTDSSTPGDMSEMCHHETTDLLINLHFFVV